MANIQLQLQKIVKLINATNIKLVDIKSIPL